MQLQQRGRARVGLCQGLWAAGEQHRAGELCEEGSLAGAGCCSLLHPPLGSNWQHAVQRGALQMLLCLRSLMGASYPPPHPGTAGEESGNNSPHPHPPFPCGTWGKSNTCLSHNTRNSLIVGSLKYLKIIR